MRTWPEPRMRDDSMKSSSPPAGVQASPRAIPGRVNSSFASLSYFRGPSNRPSSSRGTCEHGHKAGVHAAGCGEYRDWVQGEIVGRLGSRETVGHQGGDQITTQTPCAPISPQSPPNQGARALTVITGAASRSLPRGSLASSTATARHSAAISRSRDRNPASRV